MKFKLGIGLLLFGILLSNGSTFDLGSILFLVGTAIGIIGLLLIISSCDIGGKQ